MLLPAWSPLSTPRAEMTTLTCATGDILRREHCGAERLAGSHEYLLNYKHRLPSCRSCRRLLAGDGAKIA